jgi:uncharacterized protein (TIGR02453 family)
VTTSTFRGFPPEAFEFYEQLEADNSKRFWHANKATFEEAVRAPMAALCGELADYGPFNLFRPYNDLRFARDRPPYKTHQGAYGEAEGGTGFYLHIGSDGLMVAAGYYMMAKDQLQRFRQAVDDEREGAELASLIAAIARRGYSTEAPDALKSAPRGYPRDHPRVDLLRRKGVIASRQFPVAAWMGTKRVVTKVRETWEGARPLLDWLDAQVGPSTLPPEDTFR